LAIRALIQLSDDWALRIDHVLDLRSDALFVRWTTSSTLRASGGAFERLLRMLFHPSIFESWLELSGDGFEIQMGSDENFRKALPYRPNGILGALFESPDSA
jgi:hypothetical protein